MILLHSWHVRKRDKTVVRVERVTKDRVEYCTMPLLIVWGTTQAAFAKRFRPATEAEIEPNRGALR